MSVTLENIIHNFTDDLRIIFIPELYGESILYRPFIEDKDQKRDIPLLLGEDDLKIAFIKFADMYTDVPFNFFCSAVSGCLSYVLKRPRTIGT